MIRRMPHPFRAFDYMLCVMAFFLVGIAMVPLHDCLDSVNEVKDRLSRTNNGWSRRTPRFAVRLAPRLAGHFIILLISK
jgi:hypothetical protein